MSKNLSELALSAGETSQFQPSGMGAVEVVGRYDTEALGDREGERQGLEMPGLRLKGDAGEEGVGGGNPGGGEAAIGVSGVPPTVGIGMGMGSEGLGSSSRSMS